MTGHAEIKAVGDKLRTDRLEVRTSHLAKRCSRPITASRGLIVAVAVLQPLERHHDSRRHNIVTTPAAHHPAQMTTAGRIDGRSDRRDGFEWGGGLRICPRQCNAGAPGHRTHTFCLSYRCGRGGQKTGFYLDFSTIIKGGR